MAGGSVRSRGRLCKGLRGLTGIVRPHLGKINAVTGYGYALDPLRLVGVDKKHEGQGVIPRPFMCVGSFACLTA